MFYVIETVFAPSGEQTYSHDIATYATEQEADAYAEHLGIAQDRCPPNADEPRCRWHTEACDGCE